jgi:RND family efflux transporter MFP subunit
MINRYILVVTLALALTGCGTPVPEKENVEDILQVRLRQVSSMEYKVPVSAVGLLGTSTEMKLSFKTGGIIRDIRVREGETVTKGKVLALLDLSEIEAQADQARIAREKAERDLERARNLYNDSVATLEQFQNARSAFELARAQSEIAQFNLQHSRITAPTDGKIQKILVESSEMIAPGYPAILFASTENDWVVRTALTDRDIVRLSPGDSARVTMDAFPGVIFRAEVLELGALADPVTGTYEAELGILQPDNRFRTGFISRVSIYPAEIRRELVVPVEALLNATGNRAHVYIYKDGLARKVPVRTGQILDSLVAVTEGLLEGQWIITDGARYVEEDSKVRPVD